jgi:hypothetical protein
MRDRELDRILSADEDLVPSSGFVRNVMEAVRKEASAPPPIPFPWKRALPGLMLCFLSLVTVCGAAFLRPASERVPQSPGPSILTQLWSDLGALLSTAKIGGSGWIILALLLTLASITLSLRLVGRRS